MMREIGWLQDWDKIQKAWEVCVWGGGMEERERGRDSVQATYM